MKCITDKKTGEVSRVKNEIAEHEIKVGNASYASKKDWKEKVRGPYGKPKVAAAKVDAAQKQDITYTDFNKV